MRHGTNQRRPLALAFVGKVALQKTTTMTRDQVLSRVEPSADERQINQRKKRHIHQKRQLGECLQGQVVTVPTHGPEEAIPRRESIDGTLARRSLIEQNDRPRLLEYADNFAARKTGAADLEVRTDMVPEIRATMSHSPHPLHHVSCRQSVVEQCCREPQVLQLWIAVLITEA